MFSVLVMGSAGFQPAASDFQSDAPGGILPTECTACEPRRVSVGRMPIGSFRQDAGTCGLEGRAPHFFS
jgi:hypothetical protein